jgi:hypothetical protein
MKGVSAAQLPSNHTLYWRMCKQRKLVTFRKTATVVYSTNSRTKKEPKNHHHLLYLAPLFALEYRGYRLRINCPRKTLIADYKSIPGTLVGQNLSSLQVPYKLLFPTP